MPKAIRARVREDRRLLELPEPVPEAAGPEVEVTLAEVPARAAARTTPPPTVSVWPDLGLRGPFPLSRREIYEDV
jgi:hypothetical protein